MIQFNDISNFNGLVQFYEQEIGANPGDISGNTTKLKQFTARCNLALDKYLSLAIGASGTWELDDSNHTDYPIITTNLVSGQRDYTFVSDENGNLILDIYKVMIKDTSGKFVEIYPVDQNTSRGTESFWDGENTTGTPYRYSKTGNGIFLDTIPAYNSTNGLKVFINRESSHFAYNDTTKKAGYPYHQEYFFLKPAYEYARINNLTSLPRLEKQVFDLEGDTTRGITGLIAEAYSSREKDTRKVMTMNRINFI